MSFIYTRINTGNAAQFDRDVAKIFLGKNSYDFALLTNSTGNDLVYPAGAVIGRINSTGYVAETISTASDGSAFPIGILREDYVIKAGATQQVFYCTGGYVAEEMIIFAGAYAHGDSFDTIVSGRTYRDRIASDNVGIKIVRTADDNSGYDNLITQ